MTRKLAAGFTLIEVLVVLVLIALLATALGVMQFDSGHQQARREAERLRSLLQLLREQAVYEQLDFGLRIEPWGYRVLQYDRRNGWQPATRYAEQRLPQALRLRLQVSDELALPGQSGNPALPQLLVLSSDEVSPFHLFVEHQLNTVVSLHSDGVQEARLDYAQ
ncbi:type II secretion system minor pseudopilin GspH [Pseudomonas sp. R5(2019)]|uniref:type II secretion system minor pseudopilin GspH n=1 Tax=Pseudomonas sp. R5(2019) TaxID=2697566 RepID=UPI0021154463|nr:type II secretion system minor pseudopilin GspH [Pseudomonas sp. R5(2019)]NBA96200.1 type II secretion system minor pseudopilin GspH [Pseudomonas sp. R5(2019)]